MTSPHPHRRLKVGLIGAGVGLRTYLPGFAATGRAEVVGLCTGSPDRSRRAAASAGVPIAYRGYAELCADPRLDLICVTSPNEFHHEHFSAAVESGKHVLLEKPAAATAVELEKFLALDTAPGQLVVVNHQLRFHPALLALREWLRSGRIGRPYQVRIHQQGVGLLSDTPYSWRFDAGRGGGVRLAMGSHLVDLLGFLLGPVPVDTVHGTVDVVVPSRVDEQGRERTATAGTSFSALLRLAGTTALVSASAAAAADTVLDVDVLGTGGEAHFGLPGNLRVATRDGDLHTVRPDGVDTARSVFKTSFDHLARALTTAILDGDREAIRHAATLPGQAPMLRTLDAVLRSAVTGNTVFLGTPSPANAFC